MGKHQAVICSVYIMFRICIHYNLQSKDPYCSHFHSAASEQILSTIRL